MRFRHIGLLLATLAVPLAAQQPPVAERGQDVPARVEVNEASMIELQRAMQEGRATSVSLVDAYLARIAAYDRSGPGLNAIIHVNPNARADAARLDAERRNGRVRGPLHGIPIILKDNFDTEGWVTSAGSLALATHVPAEDGFIVRRLREAGAVMLAKSNMHELAAGITSVSSIGGQTKNPYDPRRCPGGSSGGTGAAIAASFAAVGWGTDTCGSIRIPAAYGSLFGLRPTQGLVSRAGIVPLALTQDVAGPLARTVTDLALALDVTVGHDPADPATAAIAGRELPRFVDALSTDALRGARLGLFAPYFRDADRDLADTVRATARAMERLGAEIVEVEMAEFDSLMANTSVIRLETKFDLMDYLATPNAPVRSLTEIRQAGWYHEALEARHRVSDTASARGSESHRAALDRQGAARARIIALMDSLQLDALIYPTMTRRPTLIGEVQTGAGACQLAAHTGLPALSAPAGFTDDELPVAIEFLGRPFSDVRLVAFAYALEQAGPRRRAPGTTPPLVDGRAPTPIAFSVTLVSERGRVPGTVSFDPLTQSLAYRFTIPTAVAARVTALVLRRVDVDGPGRVIDRLAGRGEAGVEGRITLSALDRAALREGRLVVSLFTVDAATPVAEASLNP